MLDSPMNPKERGGRERSADGPPQSVTRILSVTSTVLLKPNLIHGANLPQHQNKFESPAWVSPALLYPHLNHSDLHTKAWRRTLWEIRILWETRLS